MSGDCYGFDEDQKDYEQAALELCKPLGLASALREKAAEFEAQSKHYSLMVEAINASIHKLEA